MNLEQIVFGPARFESEEPEQFHPPPSKPPAWIDPDDLVESITPRLSDLPPGVTPEALQTAADRLSARYAQTVEVIDTSWADMTAGAPATVDASDIFSGSTTHIPPNSLAIARVSDLMKPQTARAGVLAILFHPSKCEAAVLDGKNSIHVVSVTGKVNRVQYSIPFVERKHSLAASWSIDGDRLFVGGQGGIFQTIDTRLQSAQVSHLLDERGTITCIACSPNNDVLAMVVGMKMHFVSAGNLQLLRTVSASDELQCGCFTDDGSYFIAAGRVGRGLVFDMETFGPINRFQDQGMQGIHAIDASHGLVAFGTESGVLEVFELSALREKYPRPLFTKLNLTTIVDTVKFNHTGELIAFGSSGKKDAFRVLHVRSKSVFSNWPTQNTPISFLRAVAFDSTSQFLAVGNDKGAVTLWELAFYRGSATEAMVE
jgi:U3 small nucleolar RNA-associated protein 18